MPKDYARFFCPHLFRSLVLTAIATGFVGLGPDLLAQTAQITGIGETTSTPVPGVPHDYITGVNEVVNPADGSLSVRIKAPTPHERGMNWPVYAYTYDSNNLFTLVPTWVTNGSGGTQTTVLTNLTLELALPPEEGQTVTEQITLPSGNGTQQTYSCQISSGYIFTDPDGGRHGLGLGVAKPESGGSNACSYFPMATNAYVGGDVRYKALVNPTTLAVTVIDNHGNVVGSEDVNGNQTKFMGVTQNGNTYTTTYQTPTGRQEVYTNTTGVNSLISSLPGVYGPSQNQDSYQYTWTTTTAANKSITIPYTVVNNGGVNTCQMTSIPLLGPVSVKATETLTLPNGEEYQFTYDPTTHMLSEIQYPTGAYVRYTWQIVSNRVGAQYRAIPNSGSTLCAIKYGWFAITERDVSYDGSQVDEVQKFTYTTNWPATGQSNSYEWTSKTTKVTTTDNKTGKSFDTIYTYSPIQPPPESSLAAEWENLGVVPQENTIQYYKDTTDSSSSLLKTTTKTWQSMSLMSAACETLPNGSTSGSFYTYQPYAGFSNATTQPLNPEALWTDLPTKVLEYDYGQVSSACTQPGSGVIPIRETDTAYASFGTTSLFQYTSILDRPSEVQIYGNVGGQRTLLSQTNYAYDGAGLTNVSNIVNHDSAYGTGTTVRGNPTSVTRECFAGSTGCTNSVTSYTYDIAGQVLTGTDACGNASCSDMTGTSHTTTYSYTDNYTNGSPPGTTDAYVTTITEPSPNGPAMVTKFQWGYNDGRMWSKTDENNQTTTFCYVSGGCGGGNFDPFYRLTGIKYPDTGQEKVTYSDAGPNPYVIAGTLLSGSTWLTKETVYDAYGSPTQTELTSDPEGTDYIATTYDGLERASTVTNPYRSTSDPTYGVTTSTYDALNRVTTQTEPDGSVQQWCYDDIASSGQTNCTAHLGSATTGTWVDFSDEAGKHWQRTSDVLGRLTEVIEDAGNSKLETDYQYDALGNLLRVDQWGGAHGGTGDRVRTFGYDSLSRLLCASNPENSTASCPSPATTSYTSGTVGYTYDANGNVSTKTAPLPNQTGSATEVTTNTYDELNRVTNISYSDGITPGLYYWYDVPPSWLPTLQNVVGRMANSSNSYGGGTSGKATATTYSYDSMGRILWWWEQTPSTSASGDIVFSTWDLAGDLASTTTAAGTVITYNYDAAARLTTITSSLNDSQHPQTLYALDSSVGYYANGAIRKASFGNGLTETLALNNRLQPCRMNVNSSGSYYSNCSGSAPSGTVLDFTLGYNAGSGDNGNVVSWSATGQQVFTRTYGYDNENRILNMTETASGQACKGLSWTIDQWGNMTTQTPTGGSCFSLGTSANTSNRLAAYQYDAAGNVTYDGTNYYTYDAEGRVLEVGPGGSIASYVYNENGQRVRKNTSSGWTEYFYGPNDAVQSEYNGSFPTQYVYAGSGLLAIYTTSTTEFVHPDHLGSTRLVTGVSRNIIDNMDYEPYGQQTAGNSGTTHKFTGKERDAESGLDNFLARYYSSSTGRFVTPDWSKNPQGVPYADFSDPQSLNLYAYVRNNPLSSTDADGHCDGNPDSSCDWQQPGETVLQVLAAATSEMTGADNSDPYTGEGGAQQQGGQPAPTNPDGTPQAPPTVDNNGQPIVPGVSGWKPGPGSAGGDRDTRWAPDKPIPADPSKGEGQPNASWDPSGHWDVKTGKKGDTVRVTPDGQRVDHWNNQIPRWGDPLRSIIEHLINNPPPPPPKPIGPFPILPPWVFEVP